MTLMEALSKKGWQGDTLLTTKTKEKREDIILILNNATWSCHTDHVFTNSVKITANSSMHVYYITQIQLVNSFS